MGFGTDSDGADEEGDVAGGDNSESERNDGAYNDWQKRSSRGEDHHLAEEEVTAAGTGTTSEVCVGGQGRKAEEEKRE